MTNLKRLKVSLTKHGAHKAFDLVLHFPSKDVLPNTWGRYKDIKIDRAQTAKNLSALPDGDLPPVWSDAKSRSRDTLRHLVFLGILLSHHQLIAAFGASSTGGGRGVLRKGWPISGKAFTNIKNDLEELGLATELSVDHVSYDLSPILSDPFLPDLAASLIHLKLIEAQWDEGIPLVDEAINVGIHSALSVSEAAFRGWLAGASPLARDEDELPETTDPNETASGPFKFSSGHSPKKAGKASRSATAAHTAALLHNELQTLLFDILAAKHGTKDVGTEITSAPGTSVDLVVRDGTNYDFYEIKTSRSLRKCLRQAIAQLLEYAYWPDVSRARALYVVGIPKPTKDAKKYLRQLREGFDIPIYYLGLDLDKGVLRAPI